ncbi:DUF2637 domain-containing protein [Streptomyces sp. NPDC059909]|uniref:DUF2637 domain-containing protein n=1 Tax=Streptomyces sp. NPDC059909 TaxID=3346998 RepID=UPI00364E1018
MGGQQQLAPLGLEALDAPWDPAEELAELLQTADGSDSGTFPYGYGEAVGPNPYGYGEAAGPEDDGAFALMTESTAELPRQRPAHGHRRRVPVRKPERTPLQTVSLYMAALAAVIVSMVSVLGGVIAFEPLRRVAEPGTSPGMVGWWPFLVYGPWMVASLSILRACIHRRRALHSWIVVVCFSTIATALCVAQAPKNLADMASVALPPIAALACFQQLVRQITMDRPPRQATARHRTTAPSPIPWRPTVRQAGTRLRSTPIAANRTVGEKRASRGSFPQPPTRRSGFLQ